MEYKKRILQWDKVREMKIPKGTEVILKVVEEKKSFSIVSSNNEK